MRSAKRILPTQEAEDVRYLGARRKHFMQMVACVAPLLIGGSYGMWRV